jgi:hypothetical protein
MTNSHHNFPPLLPDTTDTIILTFTQCKSILHKQNHDHSIPKRHLICYYIHIQMQDCSVMSILKFWYDFISKFWVDASLFLQLVRNKFM